MASNEIKRKRLKTIIKTAKAELKELKAEEQKQEEAKPAVAIDWRHTWLATEQPPVGSVLNFRKKFNGVRVYHYAAVRSPRGWSVTGRTSMVNVPWYRVLNFIISDEADQKWAAMTARVAFGFRSLSTPNRDAVRNHAQAAFQGTPDMPGVTYAQEYLRMREAHRKERKAQEEKLQQEKHDCLLKAMDEDSTRDAYNEGKLW